MEKRTALLLALVVALAAILVFRFSDFKSTVQFPARATSASSPRAPAEQAQPTLPDRLTGLLAKLRRNAGTAGDLIALRRALFADPAVGIAAILSFLATGEDAATGQPFTVGSGGVLTAAPTLRLFLLDMLGQLARHTGSGEGAEFARTILDKKDSPDEWALALRNIAWADSKSRAFLATKMHEMLAYEPWIASPTPGVLEAFDVAAYSGDATFIPQLSALARDGNTAVQRAATVALDRLAATSTLAVMNHLNANPTEIADLPFIRADYFAKADLADNAQREAAERYLARNDVGLAEKTKFLHALASPGAFVSDSLLATAIQPDDGIARYAGIATTTAGWLKQNRFPEVRADIAWLQERVTSAE